MLFALTRLPIIWTNAHKLDILFNGYPFLLDDIDLEQRTRHAYRLPSRWFAESSLSPRRRRRIARIRDQIRLGAPAQVASECFEANLVSADHLGYHGYANVLGMVAKGAIFTGVKLNDDPDSEASVVVSLNSSFCTWTTLGCNRKSGLSTLTSGPSTLRWTC
ncbi:uncharacterized protein BT62DRAFT_553180 [Guyanagaster necrorhizus]|uniref:Uncharacterized protein n=1 Tax=Guyanagaster necrorhizus TaxID=856835 RepID=A0A9P7VHK0_9AGAR|nr:uncharacterized protein BT62DRAFT_553180 [Guyanagaster necrorhizus MCA 3950]KAG7441178.1 hypothetical protein BT62DRAFT_553180 [Guyanagaster necrorhizus MCA 3950]